MNDQGVYDEHETMLNQWRDTHDEMLNQLAHERFLEKLRAGRSEKTIAEYERQGNSIMRSYFNSVLPRELRAKKREHREWNAELLELLWNPKHFFDFLFAKRNRVLTNSWRTNRASLEYWFASKGLFWMAGAVAQIPTEGCYTRSNPPPEGARTATKKMRGASPEIEARLVQGLRKEDSQYAEWAIIWIRLGVLFGLRPRSEWFTAQLVPATATDKAFLLVQNGKYNPQLALGSGVNARMNRAHGPERKIVQETVTDQEYALLQKFLSWKDQQTPEEFERAYKGCQALIWEVGKKLWPRRKKRPTLYSFRHQFIANAKRAGLSRVEIAALVGHATDETASMHYAKKKKGTPGAFRVSAHPEDMERVRQVHVDANFESFRKVKTPSNSNPSTENIASVEDATDYFLEDDDDLEEMWEPTSDDPDFDRCNVGGSKESGVAEPDSDSKKIKKPKGDPDFSPG